MFDKPNSTQTVGIDLEGPYLRAAEVSLKKGKPSIDQLYEVETLTLLRENVNPLYINQDEEKFDLADFPNHLQIATLKAYDVLVRSLEIKLKKVKDIDSVLSFQAEPLLPFPVEKTILDRIILAQDKDLSQLTLVASQQETVQKRLAEWHGLDIEPEVLTCSPAALACFAKHFCPIQEPLFVLHLGALETVFVLVKEGKLLAAQSLPFGTVQLQKALTEDHLQPNAPLVSLNFSHLDSHKHPHLSKVLDSWRLDITRVLFALAKQHNHLEINHILLTGEGAALQNLPASLCAAVKKNLISPEAHDSISLTKLQRLAIPIGAAISGLPHEDQLNFRQKDYQFPHPWQRLKRPLILYYMLCTLLAISIYFFDQSYTAYREGELRQAYVDLLSMMNKSFRGFEKEFQEKNGRRNHDLTDPNAISMAEITQRMHSLQKELKDTPETYPLMPNTPRVADVLAWLSSHPIFGKGPENAEEAAPIQIDSFNYLMVKRPELKKKQEKYQVKIEIEFTAATPKLAREFHDTLIAPNDFVDPKGEVKWSSNRGKYRASFFLKDKTIYSQGKV